MAGEIERERLLEGRDGGELALAARFLEPVACLIRPVDVGLVMLVVMQLHDPARDVRLQSPIVIGQIGKDILRHRRTPVALSSRGTPIFAALVRSAPPRVEYRRSSRAAGYCCCGGLPPEAGGGGGVCVAVPESGGVVEDELESGGVVVDPGGVAVSLGGGDVVVVVSLGEPAGTVDCCLEQADMATSAPRHNRSMLRFMGSPHCIGHEQARPASSCACRVGHPEGTQVAFRLRGQARVYGIPRTRLLSSRSRLSRSGACVTRQSRVGESACHRRC